MLRLRLSDALKEAMRSRDQAGIRTVRLILAALKDRDIAARSKGNADGVDEDEIAAMLQTMIKQRREAITLYEQGGRLELAEQERAEIQVIERFLPEQMDDQAIAGAVATLIGELGAGGLKDMGRIMAELRTRYAGRMDFARASQLVKDRLAGAPRA